MPEVEETLKDLNYKLPNTFFVEHHNGQYVFGCEGMERTFVSTSERGEAIGIAEMLSHAEVKGRLSENNPQY